MIISFHFSHSFTTRRWQLSGALTTYSSKNCMSDSDPVFAAVVTASTKVSGDANTVASLFSSR